MGKITLLCSCDSVRVYKDNIVSDLYQSHQLDADKRLYWSTMSVQILFGSYALFMNRKASKARPAPYFIICK